jgi:hypothetical protein
MLGGDNAKYNKYRSNMTVTAGDGRYTVAILGTQEKNKRKWPRHVRQWIFGKKLCRNCKFNSFSCYCVYASWCRFKRPKTQLCEMERYGGHESSCCL